MRADREQLDGLLAAAARHTFDLTSEVPVRTWLFELAPREHVLLLLVHHVAADGGSLAPLTRGPVGGVRGPRSGRRPAVEPLPVQYADYTLWQREVLGEEDDPESLISEQVAYWRERLAGLPGPAELPADRPRPAVIAGYRGDAIGVFWDAELHEGITRLAREHRSRVFMVLQAALATLLTRLGAGTDIPDRHARRRPHRRRAGGPGRVLRQHPGAAHRHLRRPSFTRTARPGPGDEPPAYAHQDVPFERLVEIVNPIRSMARHPLFQVLLEAEQRQGGPEATGLRTELDGVGTGGVGSSTCPPNWRERIGATGRCGGIAVDVEFAAELFDPGGGDDARRSAGAAAARGRRGSGEAGRGSFRCCPPRSGGGSSSPGTTPRARCRRRHCPGCSRHGRPPCPTRRRWCAVTCGCPTGS
ncbi:condensation domain-containing protein [Streptomyces tricolor]|nr:condensation domain-containing protein [Streptomyces tricolor]